VRTPTHPDGTILLFAPHPDDETLGCGGYLAKRLDEGRTVFVVVLTMGEKLFSKVLNIFEHPSPGEVCAIRRDETIRATGILGLAKENIIFLDYEDGSLADQVDTVVERIVPILQEKNPVEVLCTSEHEGHSDHRAACQIVRRACERVGTGILFRNYITSLRAGLSPENLPGTVEVVDIRKYLPLKRQALAQFRAHLDILSPRQPQPIATNFDNYLDPEERFLVTRDYAFPATGAREKWRGAPRV